MPAAVVHRMHASCTSKHSAPYISFCLPFDNNECLQGLTFVVVAAPIPRTRPSWMQRQAIKWAGEATQHLDPRLQHHRVLLMQACRASQSSGSPARQSWHAEAGPVHACLPSVCPMAVSRSSSEYQKWTRMSRYSSCILQLIKCQGGCMQCEKDPV